ncbi:alanine/glycine:cation symporter family protein [Henriciella aquimarina]|uniref:alanine/glycine:cation symporter family protein n=1 Tax=Henriciella aquimarina TaxID=545261 RepID=UPI001F2B59C8|nr:alanine/glycine:cation symporter family protein [Henriciella aquimarina]
MISWLEDLVASAASWIWGAPLVFLVTASGFFFFCYSRLLPFRHFLFATQVLSGRHDKADDPGLIGHFQALSVALASTIGMGNISGVAIAINMGGPGVVFWMWVSAILGMATKYFTCALAVMYRGRDSAGKLQGGPMYVIREALGRKWWPLAAWFCVACMAGCLPIFNANQLTQAVHDIALVPAGMPSGLLTNAITGIALTVLTGFVIFGGLTRISHAATLLVPVMVVIYVVAVVGILLLNADQVLSYLGLIFTDAFSASFYSGEAAFGSAMGGLILLGVRRAAFSNEAGLGTAAMAHGAAKTSEPVHEGLVAMLGPVIDTLIVCTMTALAILMTGVWQTEEANGVTLTASAFEAAYPGLGSYILLICILCFGVSSLFSYSYYGAKAFSFLFGVKRIPVYTGIYVATIFIGAISSVGLILNFIDLSFALMSVPTLISALILSPKVVRHTRNYFARRDAQAKVPS